MLMGRLLAGGAILAVVTFLGINGIIGFALGCLLFQLAHRAQYGTWLDF